MCNTCYQQERREMGAVPAKKVVYAECVSCNQHKKIRSLGKCHDCYVRDRNANLEPIECELCGETRTKYIGNLCKSCYTFRRQQKRVYHPGMCDFCLTVAVAPLKVVDGKHACVKCLRKYYPQHYEVILENARRRSRIKSADNVNIEWLIRELSKV